MINVARVCHLLILLIAIFVIYAASQSRISGGFPIDISEAPYQVSVQFIYGTLNVHKCGGSIITPEAVITVAHCTFTKDVINMGVRVGSNKWNLGGQWRRVKQKLIHENYGKPESRYDISILFLESILECNKNVQPISLNEQRVIEKGAMALVTGWGELSFNGERPITLRGVELPMLDFETCARVLEKFAKMPNDIVCAGFLEPGKDACQGDSGGPLVIDNKLVGIVSFGVENETDHYYPSYFTNVAIYASWIRKYVKNFENRLPHEMKTRNKVEIIMKWPPSKLLRYL